MPDRAARLLRVRELQLKLARVRKLRIEAERADRIQLAERLARLAEAYEAACGATNGAMLRAQSFQRGRIARSRRGAADLIGALESAIEAADTHCIAADRDARTAERLLARKTRAVEALAEQRRAVMSPPKRRD
jgi:hypothetical protein